MKFSSHFALRIVQVLAKMVSMSHAGTTPGGQIALTTVMMLIALVSVGSRLYARKLRKAKLLWDDWTVIAALVC